MQKRTCSRQFMHPRDVPRQSMLPHDYVSTPYSAQRVGAVGCRSRIISSSPFKVRGGLFGLWSNFCREWTHGASLCPLTPIFLVTLKISYKLGRSLLDPDLWLRGCIANASYCIVIHSLVALPVSMPVSIAA